MLAHRACPGNHVHRAGGLSRRKKRRHGSCEGTRFSTNSDEGGISASFGESGQRKTLSPAEPTGEGARRCGALKSAGVGVAPQRDGTTSTPANYHALMVTRQAAWPSARPTTVLTEIQKRGPRPRSPIRHFRRGHSHQAIRRRRPAAAGKADAVIASYARCRAEPPIRGTRAVREEGGAISGQVDGGALCRWSQRVNAAIELDGQSERNSESAKRHEKRQVGRRFRRQPEDRPNVERARISLAD